MIAIADGRNQLYRTNVTIGADPEVFLKDKQGQYVSAIGRFEGTKTKPKPVKKLGSGFAVQVDNVLLEYNIPPARSSMQWAQHHVGMIDHLKEIAGKQELEISIDASAEMPDKELDNDLAKVFGCEPDFDAWNLVINSPPRSSNPNLRSAGGHIHIGGIGDLKEMQKIGLVQAMDIVLGSWATLEDKDQKRKELYGRPGAMRFKDYGLEYRTISNFWLQSAEFISLAYSLTKKAIDICAENDWVLYQHKETVERMFKHNDRSIAQELLLQYGVELIAQPKKKIQPSKNIPTFATFNGM